MKRLIQLLALGCALWAAQGRAQELAQQLAPEPTQQPTQAAGPVSSAADALAPYLPAPAMVKEALLSSPLMQAARAQQQAWVARAQGIETGSAEFTLRGTTQRRREVSAGTHMQEAMVSIERPVRMWGKRGIDADLATQTQAYAAIEYADAMHEGARELMHFWFAYLRAWADQTNALHAFDLATQMQRLTQVQLKQGEISQRDAELAQAEFERVGATRALADAQRASAASALQRRYPSLSLPTQLPVALATELATAPAWPALREPMAVMRQSYLEKNHELNLLRTDAQRLRLAADRASRERLPDPTVGVFTARERAGAETVTGLLLAMPFPSAARSHHANAAMADAQVASDKVQLAEQQRAAQFEDLWLAFEHKRIAADKLKTAAQRQAQAAEKSRKAYVLGEGSLSDLLLIERMASDHLNAAQRMQLDVAQLLALIELDLHAMWDFD